MEFRDMGFVAVFNRVGKPLTSLRRAAITGTVAAKKL